jgi:hypothetical protein
MWHSVEYFAGKGFDLLGSPWTSEENIVSWSEMLLGREHALGGVETNWGTPFQEPHEQFADNFWNTRFGLVAFDSFEADADRDGSPDDWQVEGAIDYSTDGSQSHGARYADFPNAAVGIVTTTLGVTSQRFAVRPNTDYVLSAYVKTAEWGAAQSALVLEWQDDAGASNSVRQPIDGIGLEYAKFEAQFKSPATARWAVVHLDSSSPGVWFDVVRLKEPAAFVAIVSPAAEIEAVRGIPVAAALGAVGGVPPYSWQLAAGTLPPGVVLGTDGSLSGRPQAAGEHPFVARVTDASLLTDEAAFILLATDDARGRLWLPYVFGGQR